MASQFVLIHSPFLSIFIEMIVSRPKFYSIGHRKEQASVCSPTVRIIAFQAIDPGSTPGRRIFFTITFIHKSSRPYNLDKSDPSSPRYLRAKQGALSSHGFKESICVATNRKSVLSFKPLRFVFPFFLHLHKIQHLSRFSSSQFTAGTCTPITGHVIRTSTLSGSSFSPRLSWKSIVTSATTSAACSSPLEGPSCIFIGPVETASKETLEALYRQARDADYSGKPIIVDDMFDRVELKLRWYGSKFVVKYLRCSIRRQSTYSDAEEDISQAFALASIWMVFLTIGSSACVVPIIYNVVLAYQHAFDSGTGTQAPLVQFLATLNTVLYMAVGALIGYPIASASVKVLQGLWRNDLVSLKGACPNCGEEVFAFVSSDPSKISPHRSHCHVCDSLLEFRTKAEQKVSSVGRRWVYGRIYLVSRRRQRWK